MQSEKEKWRFALVVYVIGECPGYNTMTRYINLNWTSVAKPELLLHDEGYFIVKFQFLRDMKEKSYIRAYIPVITGQ